MSEETNPTKLDGKDAFPRYDVSPELLKDEPKEKTASEPPTLQPESKNQPPR